MSAFLTDLFNSIFTPGPTPTLLVATNAAFGALQLLLLALLAATRSVHFLVLSVLCGGLWCSINWFAAEVAAAAAEWGKEGNEGKERGSDERKTEGTLRRREEDGGVRVAGTGEKKRVGQKGRKNTAEDSGTETEDGFDGNLGRGGGGAVGTALVTGKKDRAASSARLSAREEEEEALRKRTSFGGDVSGTDSEWDKVSETEAAE